MLSIDTKHRFKGDLVTFARTHANHAFPTTVCSKNDANNRLTGVLTGVTSSRSPAALSNTDQFTVYAPYARPLVGNLLVRDSQFTANRGGEGAAICFRAGGTLDVKRATFIHNEALAGGAIYAGVWAL